MQILNFYLFLFEWSGQQNSVQFAIEIENRYKGIRAPHKIKGAVSGCIRECAEVSI